VYYTIVIDLDNFVWTSYRGQ